MHRSKKTLVRRNPDPALHCIGTASAGVRFTTFDDILTTKVLVMQSLRRPDQEDSPEHTRASKSVPIFGSGADIRRTAQCALLGLFAGGMYHIAASLLTRTFAGMPTSMETDALHMHPRVLIAINQFEVHKLLCSKSFTGLVDSVDRFLFYIDALEVEYREKRSRTTPNIAVGFGLYAAAMARANDLVLAAQRTNDTGIEVEVTAALTALTTALRTHTARLAALASY